MAAGKLRMAYTLRQRPYDNDGELRFSEGLRSIVVEYGAQS